MALSDAAILLSEKKAVVEIEVKRDSPLYQVNTVILDKPKTGQKSCMLNVALIMYVRTKYFYRLLYTRLSR